MMNLLISNWQALRRLLLRMERRGYGRCAALCYHLPVAVGARGYAKLARIVNSAVLNRPLNYRRFQQFQARLPRRDGRFYLIVMPGTLHFLIPCLRLIPEQVPVILLGNGIRSWEKDILLQLYPALPLFQLATLPCSSLEHGAVLDLLLAGDSEPFGIWITICTCSTARCSTV